MNKLTDFLETINPLGILAAIAIVAAVVWGMDIHDSKTTNSVTPSPVARRETAQTTTTRPNKDLAEKQAQCGRDAREYINTQNTSSPESEHILVKSLYSEEDLTCYLHMKQRVKDDDDMFLGMFTSGSLSGEEYNNIIGNTNIVIDVSSGEKLILIHTSFTDLAGQDEAERQIQQFFEEGKIPEQKPVDVLPRSGSTPKPVSSPTPIPADLVTDAEKTEQEAIEKRCGIGDKTVDEYATRYVSALRSTGVVWGNGCKEVCQNWAYDNKNWVDANCRTNDGKLECGEFRW